jgi:hypothetical protein
MVCRALAQGYSNAISAQQICTQQGELRVVFSGLDYGRSAIMNQLGPMSGSFQMRFQRKPAFS